MGQLDRLLEQLENSIDLDHTRRVEQLHLAAIQYRDIPYLPLTVRLPCQDECQMFPYAETFDDPEKMLYNELITSFSSIMSSARIKDHHPLQIRSNHGVGILASLFGSQVRCVDNQMPWMEPIHDQHLIQAVLARGIPDLEKSIGGKVFQTYRYFRDRLREYPVCQSAIRLTQPDLQGPFDVAAMLIGTDIYYQIFDASEHLHALLELITETYIRYRLALQPLLNDQISSESVSVHGCIIGGKVLIKDDTACATLSETQYQEFSKTYNERIFRFFQGGSLHYCGVARDWHHRQLESRELKGIQYGNPEFHSIESLYKQWEPLRVPILWWGYNQDAAFLESVYRTGIKTGVSLACKAATEVQAKEILQRHMGNFNYV